MKVIATALGLMVAASIVVSAGWQRNSLSLPIASTN